MKIQNILLILIFLLLFIPSTSATWYDTSFAYRVNTQIPNGTRPYQISLNISNAVGVNNATTIFTNGHANADFSDIRFTLENTTLLSYWIENIATGKVWINVTANGTVNMYYGNPSATTTSNKNNTFFYGGNITTFNNSIIHTFITNGTFVPIVNLSVEYLVVAGGGGGNGEGGAGGGAGGMLNGSSFSVTAPQSYSIIVGSGGSGGGSSGFKGINSSFSSLIAVGGGTNTQSGGSGGGGTYVTPTGGLGIAGQGNNGGTGRSGSGGSCSGDAYAGGGGGGRGTVGGDAIASKAGNGGSGINSSITGVNVAYAGGGGGGADYYRCAAGGDAGSGGGGAGGYYSVGSAGTNGTGGGGGGGSNDEFLYFNGGNGGSGIVIIRYNSILTWVTWGVEEAVTYPLELLNPTNGSTIVSPVTLTWRQAPLNSPYIYQISTDSTFLHIVSDGSVSPTIIQNISVVVSLNSGTYYWHVKNSTGSYSNWFNFTISAPPPIPGRFNISVWDEVNTSLQILNYTITLQNTTSILIKNSNTITGWTNFSSTEVGSGEYLVIANTNGTFSNYYQRMVLANSPGNVTMYLPNSTNATINIVSFSILDVSGIFPFKTSTISIYRGGLLMEKSYFSVDGTHAVYLIQGVNYQVVIQNGNNIFSSNYIPTGSGSTTITINDMTVNMTKTYPFRYNITYNVQQVVLNWNNVLGNLSSLNFTVNKGIPEINQCQLVTSVNYGQSICSIDNTTQYHVIFSALMIDGTFINQSFWIDYSTGYIKNQTGINPIDGSPMGIGFKWNYGTFVMPQWVYTWVSLLIIILLAGSFGAQNANIGSIIVGIVTLILESVGWFAPIAGIDPITKTPYTIILMGITGALTLFAFLYFISDKDRRG